MHGCLLQGVVVVLYTHTLRCISPHHNIIIMHIIPCNVVTTHSIDVRKYCLCNLLFLCWSALVRLCNRSWLVYIINASYADGMVVMWRWAFVSRSTNVQLRVRNNEYTKLHYNDPITKNHNTWKIWNNDIPITSPI